MPHPSRAHLNAIGIPVWVRRQGVGAPAPAQGAARIEPAPAAQIIESPVVQTIESPAMQTIESAVQVLESIEAQVRECRKCALHRTRTNTVFGVGRPGVACMFIGEAPGAEEDRRGEPFVGRAGKLLDAMLAAIGLGRDDVYIANIVKCQPPRNRDPQADEAAACSGYLKGQIETVSPRVLVAVGKVAAQSLLSTTKPMKQLRGHPHRHADSGLPMLVTYHPAYFLRKPVEKRKGWEDLVQLRSMLAGDAASVL